MKLQVLRSVDLTLRGLLLQIASVNDPSLRLAYEKIAEAQDLVHTLLRNEQKNEILAERAGELSKRHPNFPVRWEEK